MQKPKILIICLALLHTLGLRSQVFQKPDDKAYHVYAGAGISAISGAIIYKTTGRTGLSIIGGFGTAVLAGGLKELIYDKAMRRGVASWSDAAHTFWGGAIGSVGVAVCINIHRQNRIIGALTRKK